MEIDNIRNKLPARLQAIVDYWFSFSPRTLCLHGYALSNKDSVITALLEQSQERVLVLAWTRPHANLAQWLVTADNAQVNSCAGECYAQHSIGPALLNALTPQARQHLTIVIKNAHWCGGRLAREIQLLQLHLPGTRLLMVSEPDNRFKKRLCRLNIECIDIDALSLADARACITVEGQLDISPSVLTQATVKKLCRLSRGDTARLEQSGRALALLQSQGQESVLNRRQRKVLWHSLDGRFEQLTHSGVFLTWTFTMLVVGWLLSTPYLAPHFPLPSVKEEHRASASAEEQFSHIITSERDALSTLYETWGYDVPAGSAWCDKAIQAGLKCKSGRASLAVLRNQKLPWIAPLHTGTKVIPAVVIRVSHDTIDVLTGKQTWTMSQSWFAQAWRGEYTLLWKPSPAGEVSITSASDAEDIFWLESTLDRAMNVSDVAAGEWRPLLTEKIKLFQKRHLLTVDGRVGSSTLMHLWQATGESAQLYTDDGQ